MAKSRLDKRREFEAAEAAEKTAPRKKATKEKKTAKAETTAKKKTTRKASTATRARKKKADTPPRRRLVWVLYSSTMREEGRFLYSERDKAEEKLQLLLSKGKRRYFLQPIKEPLDSDGNPLIPDEDDLVKAARRAALESEDGEDVDDPIEADAVEPADGDIDVDLDLDVEVGDDVDEVEVEDVAEE